MLYIELSIETPAGLCQQDGSPGDAEQRYELRAMKKDLTVSTIDRQNILNNPYALDEIQRNIGVSGIQYRGETVLLKEQVAAFFELTPRTIENYLSNFEEELRQNGYEILRGKPLSELKLVLGELDVPEINFGNIKRSPQLSIFPFRAFLNLAMLITESEKARVLRQVILDIAIDAINQRTGGGTKYINQRDEDFIVSYSGCTKTIAFLRPFIPRYWTLSPRMKMVWLTRCAAHRTSSAGL